MALVVGLIPSPNMIGRMSPPISLPTLSVSLSQAVLLNEGKKPRNKTKNNNQKNPSKYEKTPVERSFFFSHRLHSPMQHITIRHLLSSKMKDTVSKCFEVHLKSLISCLLCGLLVLYFSFYNKEIKAPFL